MDGNYTVFGKVTQGLDVARKISGPAGEERSRIPGRGPPRQAGRDPQGDDPHRGSGTGTQLT